MCALSAVHLTTNDLLCVLHRNFSFRAGKPDYYADECKKTCNHYYCKESSKSSVEPSVYGITEGINYKTNEIVREGRNRCHDVRKEYKRNTVADALLVNSLSQPHNKRCTCGIANDNYYSVEPGHTACCTSSKSVTVSKKEIISDRGYNRNTYCYESGDKVHLLLVGLAKLAEEDPTFTVRTDEQSGQTIISGMGELHLEIIIDRLKREFGVECNQGRPQVSYKEAITGTVQVDETYKKQTGGKGKYAKILVSVGPADEDFKEGNLQFVNEVKGGNVPKEFIPSVQKGFQTAVKAGVLAGYPMESLKVVLLDGGFHPVDSDQLSFEVCAIQAYKNACQKANPVLLEPVMKLEVVTPEESMGDVIADLNKRRGQVEGFETSRTGARIVKAMVPLSEMFGYVTSLRTITSGRATSSMTYDHHEQVSASLTKQILEELILRLLRI